MKAYKYDSNKRYIGPVNCQLDPIETKNTGKEVWLLPGNSTFAEPLPEKEGFYVVWRGSEWDYEKKPEPIIPPEPTEEEKKEHVRFVRNGYLSYWDFSQLPDAPFTKAEKDKYKQYRQYLRDYTDSENWWEEEPLEFKDWEKEE